MIMTLFNIFKIHVCRKQQTTNVASMAYIVICKFKCLHNLRHPNSVIKKSEIHYTILLNLESSRTQGPDIEFEFSAKDLK